MSSQPDNDGPTLFVDARQRDIPPARVEEHIQSVKRQLMFAEAALANARRMLEALEPPAAATDGTVNAAPVGEAVPQSAGAPAATMAAPVSRQPAIPLPPVAEGDVGDVRRELQIAENVIAEAGSSFRNLQARELAGRIADAIRRVSTAIDDRSKAAAARPAVDALAVLPALDPVRRPAEFADAAGRAISGAGASLEGCGFPTVAYWGRTLGRLAGAFAAAGKTMVA
jgi:hypothetical protein